MLAELHEQRKNFKEARAVYEAMTRTVRVQEQVRALRCAASCVAALSGALRTCVQALEQQLQSYRELKQLHASWRRKSKVITPAVARVGTHYQRAHTRSHS